MLCDSDVNTPFGMTKASTIGNPWIMFVTGNATSERSPPPPLPTLLVLGDLRLELGPSPGGVGGRFGFRGTTIPIMSSPPSDELPKVAPAGVAITLPLIDDCAASESL